MIAPYTKRFLPIELHIFKLRFLGRKAMASPYRHRDRKPMSYDLGRNYEARTTKFGTHVDEYRVIGPINFLEHRSMALCILKTIKLN